jgi:hypothetical protein
MNYGSTEAATDNMMDISSGNLIREAQEEEQNSLALNLVVSEVDRFCEGTESIHQNPPSVCPLRADFTEPQVAEDSSEDSASFTSDTTTEIESIPIGLNCSDAVPGHICCASAYEPVDGPVWTSFFAPDDVGRASVVSHRHLLLADTIFDEQLGI